jgi:SAM-dependent methyltransferase
MIFQDSKLAHKYLDNLYGIEIGGASHNPFNLPHCLNVDYTAESTVFSKGSEILCNRVMKVDIVANGDDLPFKDGTLDYVISSHVIEHFFDPVRTIKEWLRVVKKGGYVLIIAPTKDNLESEHRPCTTLKEIIARHEGKMTKEEVNFVGGHGVSAVSNLPIAREHGHWSVWNLPEFLEICEHYNFQVVESLAKDDKVGNGFCVIIKK